MKNHLEWHHWNITHFYLLQLFSQVIFTSTSYKVFITFYTTNLNTYNYTSLQTSLVSLRTLILQLYWFKTFLLWSSNFQFLPELWFPVPWKEWNTQPEETPIQKIYILSKETTLKQNNEKISKLYNSNMHSIILIYGKKIITLNYKWLNITR